ncbi:SpoIIE family protein phosphatase [Kitasatospora sp. NBC_00315]|uniref:SpoIIE family protein phosphatase n=1 Tax=Kitasatospora sp. NBC_00315 TaxID=2975963 RepID=UPI00324584F5
MSGFLGNESVLLVGGDDVLGWSPGTEQYLGVPADRMRETRVPDLLDPWPGRSGGEAPPSSWSATLRSTGMPVRCQLLPVAGAGAADCLLRLLPERTAQYADQDAALLQALFSQAKVGLAVHDAALRVTRVSLDEQFGSPSGGSMVERLGGQPLAEALVAQDAAEIEVQLRRVLETGEAMVEVPQRARSAEQPLSDRIVSLSAIPLSGPDGSRCGVVVAFTDITAEHREKEGRFLAGEAARRIGADLDPAQCARELVEVLVPAFADGAAVDLSEAVLSGEEPDDFSGQAARLRVASLGRCERLPEPDQDPALPDPSAVPDAGESGVFSLLAGALQARGRTLGRVLMQRLPARLPFDALDEDIAEEVVTRAALSIDNARRFVHERRSAEALQRSLLPPSVEDVSAADIAYLHVPSPSPAANCGAWADAVPLSSARVAFVAGTTAARGVAAAAAAGRLRTAIQTLSDLDLAPEEVLTHIDELVRRLARHRAHTGPPADRDGRAGEIGATCLYAVYDPVTGHCAMASAGHMAPVVICPGGEAAPVPIEPRQALGVGDLPYETVELRLDPGSVLLFLAGGATLPAERAESATAGGRVAALHDLLEETLGAPGAAGRDGAALAARVRRLAPENTTHFRFPADPSVVAHARQAVTRTLASWDLEHLAFASELVASELVTNAIRYAGSPVDLRLIRDRSLICEVSDPSQTQPHLRHARPTDEGGRGLFLVHQLTQQWGSRYTRDGKTIWTAQQIDAAV